MASTFCYTFSLFSKNNYSRTLKFRSDGGEEYTVLHEAKWYAKSKINIIVECNVENKVLVTAKLYSDCNNTYNAASSLNNCKAILNFQNINFMTSAVCYCVISLIPHLQLENIQDSMMSLPIMTSVRQNVQESMMSIPVMASEKRGVVKSVKQSGIKKTKLEQLSADMQRILTTGDLSDVILSDGVNKIHAHKVILSARSPVFAKMFQHPMKENSENCVTISDIPEDALKELVSFIYTGNVTLNDTKMARNLYIAADKYAIMDLRKICSDVMQNVSPDDVLDTLALADLYEDKTLKHSALDFIARNYSQMKNTKDWEVFMKENQALAIEILGFIIEKKA